MSEEKNESSGEATASSGLLDAALSGNSDIFLARMMSKKLDERLKREGRTTFTVGELREIQNEIFRDI